MFRILFFLLIVLALSAGFAWLAARPGDLVVTFGGYRYEVTLMVAAMLIAALVASVMILWWLIRGIFRSPYAVARYFRVRRRDRGYQALSTGLIAAGAGDGGLARRMGSQAAKLLSSDQEPLLHLLDAQAALLEGDHEAARAKFTAMAEDPETRLLGLRGLYLEAERLGEREAARHYAARAVEASPQLGWAADAALEARVEERDWKGALALVDSQKAARKNDRESLARRRAVLLTAQALEIVDTDPAAARTGALEANRLQPDFVPAALIAAKALLRENDLRRAARILEASWKREPHPEVADLYVHLRHGDSTHDRLSRARKLRRQKPNHVESELAVARAALDAAELREARTAAEAAIRLAPREGAFLLLADIEEAETGDQGRVRHWLAKALRAPRDPAWVADGFVSERWAAASPVTGRIDAFEWRVPVEHLEGPVLEGHEALRELPMPEPSAPAADRDGEQGNVVSAEIISVTGDEVAGDSAAQGATPVADAAEEAMEAPPEPVKAPPVPRGPTAEERDVKPPVPDDPGVDPEEQEDKRPGALGLF